MQSVESTESVLIQRAIMAVRGINVILDKDLANIYRVTPRALRQQVKRNPNRFPQDFMFQLTREEALSVVSQNVSPSLQQFGGSMPFVFTEHGAAMLSSVLTSDIAALVSVHIVRAFIALRRAITDQPQYELLYEKIRRIEAVLNEFQNTHLIIKRPDGLNQGTN